MMRELSRAIAIAAVVAVVGPTAAAEADDGVSDPYVVEIDVRPWIESLGSGDRLETEAALGRLAALGEPAIPAIDAALRAEGETTRINLIEALRNIRSAATVPALVGATNDESEQVRRKAVEALGRLGDPRARTALETALEDHSHAVRLAAAKACLALCSSPQALRSLVRMSLEQKSAGSARTSLQRVAAADPSKRSLIEELIGEIAAPVMEDSGSSSRYLAALTVAQAHNDKALPTLQECTRETVHPLRAVMCVQAIGQLDSPQSVDALAALARSGDDRLLKPAACKELSRKMRGDAAAREAYTACVKAPASD